ncbi:MAG: hypothetical protein ACOVQ4_17720 [Flectobacillus sp.]|uniref:hypothetical protein n=1 Tax=Flectobacillus sp. TaxID=50419 RepID=UPI003B9B04AE
MPIIEVFIVKLIAMSLAFVAQYILWKKYGSLQTWLIQNQIGVVASLVVLTRLIPFILVFVILKEEPRGDVPFFYYKASHAVHLDLVYRDFWSFHAPIFSYIIALPLLIVDHASSIVALMMVGELVCVWLTYKHYQRVSSEAYAKLLHYLMLPAPVIICLLGGQEDIWLWGFALGALMIWKKSNSDFRMGLMFALSLLCLKVTVAFFLFPLFFLIKDKFKFILSMALVGIPSLALLYYLVGWDFLMLIKHTEDPYSPNLFSVLRPFIGASVNITKMNWLGLGLFLPLATWIGYSVRNKSFERAFPLLFILTYGLMQLFLPSAMAYYMFIYLVIIVFELWQYQNGKFLFVLILLNFLLIVEPFVYVYHNNPVFDSFSKLSNVGLALEYLLQWAFVITLIYVLRVCYLRLKALPELSHQ